MPDKVVAAAKLTGAHEMILELPDGYDTVIGVGVTNFPVDSGRKLPSRALFMAAGADRAG